MLKAKLKMADQKMVDVEIVNDPTAQIREEACLVYFDDILIACGDEAISTLCSTQEFISQFSITDEEEGE